ncbi:MAG TPA: hypothetical protein ENH91_02320 [Leeuwenhoekiella sp.]|nr:hypothetical protein [Leeuwenhoekiella sp.]
MIVLSFKKVFGAFLPLLFCLLAGSSAMAQIDNNGGTFKIPAIKDTAKANNPEKTLKNDLKMPLSDEFPALPKAAPVLRNPLDDQDFYMQKREQFADNGARYTGAMNRRQQGVQADNQPGHQDDQDLGTYRSGSKFVKIVCRDFSYVDGDKVSVLVNDEVVQSLIVLGGTFRGFNLDLKPGFNKISFKALNQGTSGPNTAQFVIYDDTGAVISSNEWNLLTGVKANLVIVKEE